MLATPFKQIFFNNWCQHKNVYRPFTITDSAGMCLSQTFCCRETFYFQFRGWHFPKQHVWLLHLISCCIVVQDQHRYDQFDCLAPVLQVLYSRLLPLSKCFAYQESLKVKGLRCLEGPLECLWEESQNGNQIPMRSHWKQPCLFHRVFWCCRGL